MEGLRPKQLAQKGMSYIEKAILDLLFEAEMDKRQGLGPTEISRRLGTLLSGGNFKDGIVASLLIKLEDQGLVAHVGRGDWRLSEMARENRRDD